MKTRTIELKKPYYITGRLLAKYRAEADGGFYTNGREHESPITIYEAEVFIDLEKINGEKNQQRLKETFDQSDYSLIPGLPVPLRASILHGEGKKFFLLHVVAAKFRRGQNGEEILPELKDIQQEGKESFGTIEGDFIGYVEKTIPAEVPDIPEETTFTTPSPAPPVYPRLTGEQDLQTFSGYDYIRYKVENEPGVFGWSSWHYYRKRSTGSGTEAFGIIGYVLAALLLFAGGAVVWILVGAGLLIWLLTRLPVVGVFRFAGKLLRVVFSVLALIILAGGLFNLLVNYHEFGHRPVQHETEKEQSDFQKQERVGSDTLIKNFRRWDDYHGHHYEGWLAVRIKDWRNAKQFREKLVVGGKDDQKTYHEMCENIIANDSVLLENVYMLFDSIQKKNKLSRDLFAEAIISCVQDIPYVLITEGPCSASYYQPGFVHSYLEGGGKCEGQIRFGVFSPVEFVATMQGDCDTRTFFTWTVLRHYNYDAAILTSVFYGHSILGVRLEQEPKPQNIKKEQYSLCELTAYGLHLGQLNTEIADLNQWTFELKKQR